MNKRIAKKVMKHVVGYHTHQVKKAQKRLHLTVPEVKNVEASK